MCAPSPRLALNLQRPAVPHSGFVAALAWTSLLTVLLCGCCRPSDALVTPPSVYLDVFSNPKFQVLLSPVPFRSPHSPHGSPDDIVDSARAGELIKSGGDLVPSPDFEEEESITLPLNGRKFKCFLPKKSQQESTESALAREEQAAAAKLESDQKILAAAISILELLRKQDCIYSVQGWWTYELCYGKYLRQFHPRTPEEERKFPEKKQDYIMGYHPSASSKTSPASTSPGPLTSQLVEFEIDGQSANYLSQVWDNGTPCEVGSSGPRSTEVRFYCAGFEALAQVREVGSCRYVLVVNTPKLCALPSFVAGGIPGTGGAAASASLSTDVVRCYPEVEGDIPNSVAPVPGSSANALVAVKEFVFPQPSSQHALLVWSSEKGGGGGTPAASHAGAAVAANPAVNIVKVDVAGAKQPQSLDAMLKQAIAKMMSQGGAGGHGEEVSPDDIEDDDLKAAAAAAAEVVADNDFGSLIRKLLGNDPTFFGDGGDVNAKDDGKETDPVAERSDKPKVNVVIVDQNGNIVKEQLGGGDNSRKKKKNKKNKNKI
ncbi:hypothetical protein DFJ73DRAFT_858769 [Zopfochytrium polystomum]|nr:hypothetical protein DFJ73DRAFT_858769 [Zopfochytrium polystomum]